MNRNVTKNIEEFELNHSKQASITIEEMYQIIDFAKSRLSEKYSEDPESEKVLIYSVLMAWNAGYQTGYKSGKRNRRIVLTPTKEMVDQVKNLKEKLFPEMSYSEVYRYLILTGLEVSGQ